MLSENRKENNHQVYLSSQLLALVCDLTQYILSFIQILENKNRLPLDLKLLRGLAPNLTSISYKYR